MNKATWLRNRARHLRGTATDAERLLWRHLRNRQLLGCKFRRQVVVDDYIVDFLCLEVRLIIEADGGEHMERAGYDESRSRRLEKYGYRVLRFWNHQILQETDAVLEAIGKELEKRKGLF